MLCKFNIFVKEKGIKEGIIMEEAESLLHTGRIRIMYKFKKMFTVVTVITILATIMATPAFAQTYKYEAEAKVLNDLGLMAGYGLGDYVTRVQGIIFALKAAGKADEVEAMSDAEASRIISEEIIDAAQVPDWAYKWVAYAVKYGYTSGIDASVLPKVKFAPTQQMTAAELLVWLMNIGMGYKAGTNTSVSEAVNAGIIRLSQAMEFGPKLALTRDDIAGILYGACKNGKCADGTKFIQSLVDAGFVSEKAAIAAGFLEAKPTELKVVNVKASSLKQLVVEFNMPIKEAGNENNYIIENEDEVEAVIDEDSTFELSSDKKTVTITLTNEAAQQEVIDLTIRDIESETGLKLGETTIKKIEFFDNVFPKAVSAEVVGKYTIKVKFSEPIREPDNDDDPEKYFSVNDGEYLIEKIEKVNNDTEINITLYSALEKGNVTIEAKPAIRDYAGFSISKKTFTVKVTEDKESPYVVGYRNAKPTEVTLIFNEDIELLEESDDRYGYPEDYLENFYHTNRRNTASDLKVNGKELTIVFTDSRLPQGRAYIYIDAKVLQDLWGNKNSSISYVVDVTVDKTAPVLQEVEQEDEESIRLIFSKELDEDSAEDLDNYTILDKNGKDVSDVIYDAVLDKNGKEVVITFNEAIYGTYSIVVRNVEDLVGNIIAKTTKSFTMKDMTPPGDFEARIYHPGQKGQMLKVNFNDTMATSGRYSVLDLEKYEIVAYDGRTINLADMNGVTIKIVDSGKAVEIRIPSSKDVTKKNAAEYIDYYDFSDEAAYAKKGVSYIEEELYIARVADADGNRTQSSLNRVEIALPGHVGVKDAESVALTAKNTITITLDGKIATFDPSDFEGAVYYYDGNKKTNVSVTVTRARHSVNSDGISVITLTLRGWDKTAASVDGKPLKVKVTNADSRNSYGETVYIPETTVVDKAAPEVVSVVFINSTTIKVILSEDIDSKTAAADSKNGFSVSGGSAQLTKAIVDGNEITLIGENFKNTTDVSYNQVFGLADAAGNVLKSFTRTDVLD